VDTAMLTARNATLEDLAAILQTQKAEQLDIVAPAATLRSKGGVLHIEGVGNPTISESGVTPGVGKFRPTGVFDEGLAEKLQIPVAFLRRMREQRTDLYDLNVNGLLHGKSVRKAGGDIEVVHPADDRQFLLRLFRGDEGGEGVARAMLSDSYKTIDNLDILTAILTVVRASNVQVEVAKADLTDRRMYVDLIAPQMAALAPVLLGGYRNPFEDPRVDAQRRGAGRREGEFAYWRGVAERDGMGYDPGTEPVVYAGVRISNSEVGGGAFSIVPRLILQVCRNGMTISQDVVRHVHLGGKLDTGLIEWSDATQRKQLDLIMGKTADAMRAFLDPQYLASRLEKIEADAGKPVDEPNKTIEIVGRSCGFTKAETQNVLDFFIRGGQMTAGGVANAITAFSQTVADADRAGELDAQALRAMELVPA
jgi:hypothetical protein